MALQVIDRDERLAVHQGDRLAGHHADDDAADQARPAGRRHRIELARSRCRPRASPGRPACPAVRDGRAPPLPAPRRHRGDDPPAAPPPGRPGCAGPPSPGRRRSRRSSIRCLERSWSGHRRAVAFGGSGLYAIPYGDIPFRWQPSRLAHRHARLAARPRPGGRDARAPDRRPSAPGRARRHRDLCHQDHRRQGAGSPAERDRRQGPVHQGDRGGAAGRRDRHRRPFHEGRADLAARRPRSSTACCRARIRATC